MVKLFSASAGDVLLLLDLCLRISSTDRLVSVRLLRCFSSWVQLQVMTLPQLANCAILGHVFATLSNPQSSTLVHEAASDAVCALLQVVGEQKNEDDPSLPPHQRPHQVNRVHPSAVASASEMYSIIKIRPPNQSPYF